MLRADIEFVVDRPLAAGHILLHRAAQARGAGMRQRRGHRDGRLGARLAPAGRVVIDTMPPVAPLP